MTTTSKRRPNSRLHEKGGGTFRILIGMHIEDGPQGCDCDDCLESGGKNHVYVARGPGDPEDYTGDIINSKSDLVTRFNAGPNSMKFERITNAPVPFTKSKPLAEMTLDELREIAAVEEIDLGELTDRNRIEALIRKSL